MRKHLKKFVVKPAIRMGVLLSGLSVVIYFFQERALFYPSTIPQDYKFDFPGKFEERTVPVGSDKIHSLYFHAEDPKGVILYLHGNAGNLSDWGEIASLLCRRTGWDVWMLDYPGFGKSTGKIRSESQLHAIAKEFYRLAKESRKPIFVYGRSIGTGIAVKLASENDVAALALETPYYSLSRLGDEIVWWAPSFLMRYGLLSNTWIEKVKAPVWIVHGDQDELIPFDHAEALSKLVKSPLTFTEIKGGSHNNLELYSSYWASLEKFLSGVNVSSAKL